MIIEFASEVSNLAWRVSQSQNGGAIFTLTKWSPMFGSVVFDHQWCILIVMSVKSSFYNEYDIKNNEKHVLWVQRSFQNHHQTFHDRCPEKIGPLPKKSDHWFTRTCPENIRPAPTWLWMAIQLRALETVSKFWGELRGPKTRWVKKNICLPDVRHGKRGDWGLAWMHRWCQSCTWEHGDLRCWSRR